MCRNACIKGRAQAAAKARRRGTWYTCRSDPEILGETRLTKCAAHLCACACVRAHAWGGSCFVRAALLRARIPSIHERSRALRGRARPHAQLVQQLDVRVEPLLHLLGDLLLGLPLPRRPFPLLARIAEPLGRSTHVSTQAAQGSIYPRTRPTLTGGEPSPGADVGGVCPAQAQMWQQVSPDPSQMWQRVSAGSPVPAVMWQRVSPVRGQMWADVGGVSPGSPVPAQMWAR